MANYIPGQGSLGYSFDVFGEYSIDSIVQRLFDMVYEPGGQTYEGYLVPANVDLSSIRKTDANSTYVDTRTQIEEYFALKAKVSATYGAFSGQFKASYSMTDKTDISYQFGIVETFTLQYMLTLKDRSESGLTDSVKNSTLYKRVPRSFTDKDRERFFQFFDMYGLYYMPAVVLGSRLFYSSCVHKSYNFSSEDAKTKLNFEYNAVFGASGEAAANWSKATQTWASQREVKLEMVGGDPSTMLNALIPSYGVNHQTGFDAWAATAQQYPAVVDFRLESISGIFSADKAAAVNEAIEAYLRHKLFVESKTGTCLINFDAKPVITPPVSPHNAYGYQLAAIRRSTLDLAFARSYASGDFWGGYQALYEAMLAAIQEYNTPDYIIAFTAYSNFATNAPIKAFAEFLQSCGAGAKLDLWLDTRNSNATIGSCCTLAHTNYVFVGIPGSALNTWYEDFQRAGSCDTAAMHWQTRDGWLDSPAPMASLLVDVYQLLDEAAGTGMVAQLGRAR